MKNDPGPTAACAGKARFESAGLALEVARRKRHRRGQRGAKRSIYRCRYCGGWHVAGPSTGTMEGTVR